MVRKKKKHVGDTPSEILENESLESVESAEESDEWVDEEVTPEEPKKEKVKKVSKPKGKAKSPSRYAKFQREI